MCTDNRDEIIDLIKRLYADKTKKNLPIFAPSSTGLDKFWTTKEEASKGLTRMPRRETALEEENIIVEQLEEPEEDLKEDEDVVSKNFTILRISKTMRSHKECRQESILSSLNCKPW